MIHIGGIMRKNCFWTCLSLNCTTPTDDKESVGLDYPYGIKWRLINLLIGTGFPKSILVAYFARRNVLSWHGPDDPGHENPSLITRRYDSVTVWSKYRLGWVRICPIGVSHGKRANWNQTAQMSSLIWVCSVFTCWQEGTFIPDITHLQVVVSVE